MVPISIFQFLAPVFIFDWIWRRMQEFLAQLPGDKAARDDSQLGGSKTLVLAYSQDEAFMALSVVINLLSLVHQVFFICIAACAWISSRTKIVDWLAELPGIVFVIAMMPTVWGISGAIAIDAVAKVWPDINSFAERILAIGSSTETDYLQPVLNFSVAGLLGVPIVLGLIVVLTSLSLITVGTIRVVLFLLIGVLDQVRSKTDFFNAAVGGVVISMIPEGRAQSVMVDGRAMFNHAKIYDDPKTLKEIIRFVSEETNPV